MLPTPGEHVLARKAQRIGIKTALMEYAAMQRRLPVTRYGRRTIVVDAPGGSAIAFRNMNGPRSSNVGQSFCDHKELGRQRVTDAGLVVTPWALFGNGTAQFDKAWAFAQELDAPVVVKPTRLARGVGISTQVRTRQEFEEAWARAFGAYRRGGRNSRVLVERHFTGEDFRFYVIGDRVISATHRKRAHVIGDGQSTLLELINRKNEARSENPYLRDYLLPTTLNQLEKVTTLETVPDEGEETILRGQSNLSAGGDSIDVTDQVHPGFKEIVVGALAAIPGMEYAGVDIIAPSVAVAPTSGNHVVSEVEYSPAPITHFPSAGPFRDMTGELLDYYLERYP